MYSIFYQLLQIQEKSPGITADIAMYGGLLTCVFALTFVFFFIVSRHRQNNLVTQQKLMRKEFERQLLQTQLEMQEHTFNIISQEIHDNVGQTLSLAKVQLNILGQEETLNGALLIDIKQNMSKIMTDLRDIAKSLNSDRARLLSLSEMTNHELQRIQNLGTINAVCKIEGEEEDLQQQKKLILFRIIQESLQNILKHSKAKNIEVLFNYQTNLLLMKIIDNGVGFDLKLITRKEGLGLQNIINRSSLIGGQATISSIANIGTTITIILPYV